MVPPVSNDVAMQRQHRYNNNYIHDNFMYGLPQLGHVNHNNHFKNMCNTVMCPLMDYQISGPIWTYNSCLPKGRIMHLYYSSVYGHPVISIN